MRKRFLALMLCLAVAAPLSALQMEVFAVRNLNLDDQWACLAFDESPVVNTAAQVATGQPFDLRLFFAESAIKDGVGNVEITVRQVDPNGKESALIEKPNPAIKAKVPEKGLTLSPLALQIAFEPSDPVGAYRFIITAADRNNGTTAEKTVSVEHTGKYRPAERNFTDAELSVAFMNYYRAPDAAMIPALWRALLRVLPQMRERQKKSFNPASQLAFFAFVLTDNPQVHETFLAECGKLSDSDKRYAETVIEAVPELRDAAQKAGMKVGEAAPHLFQVETITHPVQQDVLWSEFFARGTFAPIEKIARSLIPQGKTISVKEYKALEKPTQADFEALFRGVLVTAAEWSLSSNAANHPLVFSYLDSIVRRNKPEDAALNEKIKKVLASALARRKAAARNGNDAAPGGPRKAVPEK